MVYLCAIPVVLALLVAGIDSQVTYQQPERTIRCPLDAEVCEITLTVSRMTTLTAYSVLNGARGMFGVPLTVNSGGDYDFVYGAPSGPTTLFEPIPGDGITRRNLFVFNDQFPGPTLIGYTNQKVQVRVVNNLIKDAVSVHWHGMHLPGTPYMDGSPFVTQCPIHPRNDFVYEFQLYPQGTFWYHAHFGTEVSNGLYGALIVVPRDPPPTDYIDMPEAHTLLLNEWFPVNSEDWQLDPILFSDPINETVRFSTVPIHDGSEGGFSPFIGGLINQAGWLYTADRTSCTRIANTKLPFFNVDQGNSYRFRLIGSQANIALRFSIQGHRLRLAAADGFETNTPIEIAQEVEYIILHAGERYDFILNANESIDNYVMIAETLEVPSILEEREYCVKAHRAYSVLHYNGANDTLPSDFDSYDPAARCASSQCFAINCPFENYPSVLNTECINLHQLQLTTPEVVPSNDVSETVFLNFGFSNGLSVNSRVFSFPSSPILSQRGNIDDSNFCEYSQDEAQLGVTNCIHTYTAQTETVEMVFMALVNPAVPHFASAHPVHIHGHHFRVLHTGYPSYTTSGIVEALNPDITCEGDGGSCHVGVSWTGGTPPPSECEVNGTCPTKDTVMVPTGGYVRVRFSRENWGWWLLHCHIESHFILGMAMIVNATAAPGAVAPPVNYPQCGSYGSSVSPSTAPSVFGEEYRSATIGLAVAAGVLLLALVVVSIALLCVVLARKSSSEKEENHPMDTLPSKEQ